MIHLPSPRMLCPFSLGHIRAPSDATPPFRLWRQGSTTHRLPPSSHLLALSLPSKFQPATTTPFPRVLPVPVPHTLPCPNPKSKHTVNSTERRQVRSAQVALTYTMMPALLNILPCQLLRSESRLPELTECSPYAHKLYPSMRACRGYAIL